MPISLEIDNSQTPVNIELLIEQGFGILAGEGNMMASTYDPTSIEGDAFARANHTGAQAISTVTGLQTELDLKASKLTGAVDALAVAGNATVGGTLGVTGATTIASASISGNATVSGTLAVTGATTMASGSVTGALSVGGQLEATAQALANADRVVTRGLLASEDAFSLHSRRVVTSAFASSSDGTGSFAAHIGEWSASSGTAAAGRARVPITRNLQTFAAASGANIRCDRDLSIALIGGFTLRTNSVQRLIVGDAGGTGAPPTSGVDALAARGWGYEVRLNDGNDEIRVVSFDESFAASDWVIRGTYTPSGIHSFILKKVAGVITLLHAYSGLSAGRPSTTPLITHSTQVPTAGFTGGAFISALSVNHLTEAPAAAPSSRYFPHMVIETT